MDGHGNDPAAHLPDRGDGAVGTTRLGEWMRMECMGCGKYIDEDKETIAHDYVGNEYHESCLQEETKESEAYALARGVQ